MITYTGKAATGIVSVFRNRTFHAMLDERHDLRNHSPDGFAWGYGGSGPAQLALALLADLYDDQTALISYQAFKWAWVARLDTDRDWQITEDEIRAIVASLGDD